MLAELEPRRDREILMRYFVAEQPKEKICADFALTSPERSGPGDAPSTRITLGPTPEWMTLALQPPPSASPVRYQVDLRPLAGESLWRGGPLDPDAQGRVTLHVHSSWLEAADYVVALDATTPGRRLAAGRGLLFPRASRAVKNSSRMYQKETIMRFPFFSFLGLATVAPSWSFEGTVGAAAPDTAASLVLSTGDTIVITAGSDQITIQRPEGTHETWGIAGIVNEHVLYGACEDRGSFFVICAGHKSVVGIIYFSFWGSGGHPGVWEADKTGTGPRGGA